MASRKNARLQWYRVDLHLHTPASSDYQEGGVTYLDILRRAEQRGLDMIAFTDHNTVTGYAAMMAEIEQLAYLEKLGRAQPDEVRRLAEYRHLLDKVLVLPGFEFTATLGFHILGLFDPQTPLRQIEHLLLSLHVPLDALDRGNSEVGASSDVLSAYRVINEAGGICIAAHANSSHGIAMRGFDFGGQTKIAYTQDSNLHALEVTDLDGTGRGTTQRFFDGTKPEYPRKMRCIQGSDAHRLNGDKRGNHVNPGVGDRVTEVLLKERTFKGLLELFQSTDFSRSRPASASATPQTYDFIQAAREEGPNLVQSFHEAMTQKGGRLFAIVADVCAFANTNGGTIYIGLSADKKKPPVGVANAKEAIDVLRKTVSQQITPTLDVEIDSQETQSKTIIRVQVPRGSDRPYAIEDNKIYVRDEAETSLAVRDEIVNLVRQRLTAEQPAPSQPQPGQPPPSVEASPQPTKYHDETSVSETIPAPRAGVEIVGVEQKSDARYYIMRDLRNGAIVKNVTRMSARKLWHYAITERETDPVDPEKVQWQGDIGLWKASKRAGETRYDLVQRMGDVVRVYYGVTENGMHGPWQAFLEPEGE